MDRHRDDWERWLEAQEEPKPSLPASVFEVERWLRRLPAHTNKTVADLGCGLGARLTGLSNRFATVIAVDHRHAPARAWPPDDTQGVEVARCALTNLEPLRGRLDVAIALGSISASRLSEFDRILVQVRRSLVEGGLLLATFRAAPKGTIARAMLLDGGDETPAPTEFHEIELQYRLQRAGLRGAAMRRVADPEGGETLVCRAVRRADN